MPARGENGRKDISRLWALVSIIGAIVAGTIYVLTQVHSIAAGQVVRHEQKSLRLSHPELELRLERIEQKIDRLGRWTGMRAYDRRADK